MNSFIFILFSIYIVAVVACLTVKLIVTLPPVSFAITVIVAVLSSINCVLATMRNSNPATATLCASSLSPINLGVVGSTEFCNALVT
jgi:hypothetical protein